MKYRSTNLYLRLSRQSLSQAPNVRWGTDGTRILTVDDGYVWLFTAVVHWNTECAGWHVVKHGSRYEAMGPISMGLRLVLAIPWHV